MPLPVNASVRRRMCVSVSGLMYRDAPTTAANLGAFVRLIFIYPPHEKGRKERGNCVSIMLRRPSTLGLVYTRTHTHTHRLRRTMISLSISLVRLDDSRTLTKRRKLSFDHSRAPTLHRLDRRSSNVVGGCGRGGATGPKIIGYSEP